MSNLRYPFHFLFAYITIIIAASCTQSEKIAEGERPPAAEKQSHEVNANGRVRDDPYYWMRLTDEQKNAAQKDEQTVKVISFLEAQNAYLDKKLDHTKGLQQILYKEMAGRVKKDDNTVPYFKNGYWYYVRFEAEQEYPIFCRKKGTLQNAEEILLDVNKRGKDMAFVHVSDLEVSDNNRFMAYTLDSISRRRYGLFVVDLTNGKYVGQPMPNCEGDFAWSADNKTIFFTQKDPVTLRSNQVFRHQVGQPPSQAQRVYEEKDDSFYTSVGRSKSGKYITINLSSTTTDDHLILEADKPEGNFRPFTKRTPGVKYDIYHYKDIFYVITNEEAINFKLMQTPVDKTSREFWSVKIPSRKDTLLEDVDVFNNYLVLSERAKANPHLRVIDQKTSRYHYVPFDEPAYSVYTHHNYSFDSNVLRFTFTSLKTPNTVYDYDMGSREMKRMKQQVVEGEFDADNYVTERLWATASDGTAIPLSIVYKKGLQKNSSNPALIYGYGSYGASANPGFDQTRLSLLDRGFVFAVAHIRGGQDMGREWYEDGKLFKKKNTFTDFIACSQFLVEQGFTNPEKLFAMGGSAGGLLMGAVTNMRPDLYKGIVAHVPFVDVVTTMLDRTIPLTSNEFDEWGNPENLEFYDYMLEYSPYDQAKPMDYPHMLVTTGFHDSQVQYWEPAKWVARLQELNTGDSDILLKTDMSAGHGGASGRFKEFEETAMVYAFLLNLAGITQ